MARRSRSRDLAGLAALGALGYTFFGPGRDRPKGVAPAPVSEGRPVPAEEILRGRSADMPFPEADMAQDVRIQRAAAGPDNSDIARFADVGTNVNESGDVYYLNEVPGAARSVSGGTRSFGGAATPRAARMSAAAADAGLVNRAPVIGPRSTGVGGATAAEMAAYRRRQQEQDAMRGRGYNAKYKKGGAVKAKKMASGGMTSASKRADGIATKGKTKCKMY